MILPDTITLDGEVSAHLYARLDINEDGSLSGNVFVMLEGAKVGWWSCDPDDFETFCRACLGLVVELQ